MVIHRCFLLPLAICNKRVYSGDMRKERIDPEKMYNLRELLDVGVFSVKRITSHNGLKSLIYEDRQSENLLQTEITGQGRGKDYKIKGSNIIQFLKSQYELVKKEFSDEE